MHYLSTLRSFRGTKPAELVRFGDEGARVEGLVKSEQGTDELAVVVRSEGREATVNGKAPELIADYLRVLPSVTFTPDDILLLKGEGGPRRRALDRAVFGLMAGHFRHLLDYNRALKQKNALLRSGRAADSELDTWDASLAEHGAKVLEGRHAFVQKVGPLLAEFFHDISGGQPKATLRYRGLPADATRLAAELAAHRGEERVFGHTRVGPHRDDLVPEIGGKSVRRYASQGQHRMFALALKVAEIELHRRELGRHPVLLLDDVKSELDQDRVRYLFDFLDKIPAQLFVTATDFRELSGEIRRPTTIWSVRAGVATAAG